MAFAALDALTEHVFARTEIAHLVRTGKTIGRANKSSVARLIVRFPDRLFFECFQQAVRIACSGVFVSPSSETNLLPTMGAGRMVVSGLQRRTVRNSESDHPRVTQPHCVDPAEIILFPGVEVLLRSGRGAR